MPMQIKMLPSKEYSAHFATVYIIIGLTIGENTKNKPR